jgi:Helicase conserved C-terminal domain/WYL domain
MVRLQRIRCRVAIARRADGDLGSRNVVRMGGNGSSAPRSLADDLRARSDTGLGALLHARPDLVNPVPVDIAQLASRATTRASIVRAIDRMNSFTLHVLDAIAILPEPATPRSVGALLGVPEPAARAAVDELRTAAIVWGSDDDLRMVRAVHEILGPYPAGLGPPLREVLATQSPRRLASLAADVGLDSAGGPKTDAHSIADVIMDRLDDLLAELGDEATEVLRMLAEGPPTGRVDDAQREVGIATARTPIDTLLARGLLIPIDEATVVLPREVGIQLRGGALRYEISAEPPVPAGTQRDPTTVDRTAGAGAFETTRRIETLLDLWSADPPTVLRAGGLGVRDLRRTARALDADEPAAGLLADLAYAAGLVAPSSDFDQVWLPTPSSDTWRRLEPADRWAAIAGAWLGTSRTAGLIGSRDERGRLVTALGRELGRPLAPEIRRLVLDVLADVPLGMAPEVDQVLAAVRWIRPRHAARGAGRLRDDLVRWTLREAEVLGLTGHGALATYIRPLLAGRHVEAAAALAAVMPERVDHILIQADFTAVAPGPLAPDIARELAQLADVESRGGATVHRFTAASIRQALDAGQTATDVHAFLKQVSRTPVPQPLTYLVDDVARQHGRLRVGGASSFVRCDDEATLARILADPLAGALGLRRLAPTVLGSDLDPVVLLERLRGIGLHPTAEAADGSVAVRREEARRAPDRTRTEPRFDRPAPADALLAAAVRAIRAGDRTTSSRLAGAAPARLGRSASAQTIADLRRALDDGSTVWIGYVDHDGVTTERVVDPVNLDGGWLAAFDHRAGAVRSFAVHRISGVAPVDAASR